MKAIVVTDQAARGSMSGKSGVLGPRTLLPERFTSKPSCSEGGIAWEIVAFMSRILDFRMPAVLRK